MRATIAVIVGVVLLGLNSSGGEPKPKKPPHPFVEEMRIGREMTNAGKLQYLEAEHLKRKVWDSQDMRAAMLKRHGPITPFEAAQAAERTDENIEVVVDGQVVHLVGPGAEALLDRLGVPVPN